MVGVALGEMSELLLGGQRAMPNRLLEAGFRFRCTQPAAAPEEAPTVPPAEPADEPPLDAEPDPGIARR